jgi:biopolymer transport protein TolR
LSSSEIAALIEAQLQSAPDTPVIVKGDGAVPYNQVIQLMVLLQGAGASSVGLMTDSPDES